MQPILIPKRKWEVISMDLIPGLSKTSRNHDSIMVMVDRLTKVVHFNPVKSTNSAREVAHLHQSDSEVA